MKKKYWHDRKACWEINQCNEILAKECPAYLHQEYPCWEVEGTYCKLNDENFSRNEDSRCYSCKVYLQYGKGTPIQVKIFDKGVVHAKLQRLLVEREDYKKRRK